jgi:hypothetical protein
MDLADIAQVENRLVDAPGRLTMTIYSGQQDIVPEVDQFIDNLNTIIQMPENFGQPGSNEFCGYVVSLYREVLAEQAQIRFLRDRDPIASRLREELYRRLDVRPDLRHYMAYPEFHFHFLHRLKRAPRLQAFLEHKWEKSS